MGKTQSLEDFGEIEIDDRQASAAVNDIVAEDENANAKNENQPKTKNETKDNPKTAKKPKRPWSRKKKIIFAVIVLVVLIAAAVAVFLLTQSHTESSYDVGESVKIKYYSALSGEELASADLITSPTYCIQIPNGTDGARPQVGLSQASVVFEAIAEAGITRFAAIYQNVDLSAIGPIRSLRQYYLDWDTPFDCTVVHAGGSDEALSSLKTGGYRDLTENLTYQWRDNTAYARPNNLFTSSTLLNQFNNDKGYTTSSVNGLARLTPEQAEETAKDNQEAANAELMAEQGNSVVPLVETFTVNFGRNANYNTIYTYDQTTNSYLRAYANGNIHKTYTCPAGLTNPAPQRDCGEATQVSPKAVAVMVVQESLASDRYHQNITTTGAGKSYVFQNGEAFEGEWRKASAKEQIEFYDTEGNKISFTPGQLWIAAIPESAGSVQY